MAIQPPATLFVSKNLKGEESLSSGLKSIYRITRALSSQIRRGLVTVKKKREKLMCFVWSLIKIHGFSVYLRGRCRVLMGCDLAHVSFKNMREEHARSD
jgi:hypothetical protein